MQETTVDMSGLQGAGKLWPGKDYVNYIVKDFVDLDQAYNGLFIFLPLAFIDYF